MSLCNAYKWCIVFVLVNSSILSFCFAPMFVSAMSFLCVRCLLFCFSVNIGYFSIIFLMWHPGTELSSFFSFLLLSCKIVVHIAHFFFFKLIVWAKRRSQALKTGTRSVTTHNSIQFSSVPCYLYSTKS